MKKITLTGLLTYGFSLILLIAVISILSLGLFSTEKNTEKLFNQIAEMGITSIEDQLKSHLRPINNQLEYLASLIESGYIATNDSQQFNKLLQGTLAATPQVVGIAYVDEQFFARYYARDKTDVFKDYWRDHPVITHLLSAPEATKRVKWLDPVYIPGLKASIIQAYRKVSLPNGKTGLLLTGVTLEKLSAIIKESAKDMRPVIFLLNNQQQLLGLSSTDYQPGHFVSAETPAPTLANLAKNHPLKAIWGGSQTPSKWLKNPSIKGHSIALDDNTWEFIYTDFTGFGDSPWIVGIYFSYDQYADIEQTFIHLLIASCCILLVMMLLAVGGARFIGNRLRHITMMFAKVGQVPLTKVPRLKKQPLQELNLLAHAFNNMLDDLQSHENLRRLFGQYVPHNIAKQLMQSNGTLEPKMQKATIVFIEIEGFTALAEQISPQQLFTMLNEYFSLITRILEKHDGMITQFQGDAVLAVFNINTPAEHARQALTAAIEIQHALSTTLFCNHPMRCRIGINSGEVIAGSVGAKDRLNYTVHGDDVNLTARLEGLNKEYNTRILISEATHHLAPDFTCREIGKIHIRGKQRAVSVFAPNSERSSHSSGQGYVYQTAI
ncbi:adenylate/guanylate cyclase domain-containing protein [Zooshikella sp. RANM57]|uniref:adenylate/guanylate cyclase domain-containing protein n=1 Tax=Zooshikella sp. RANM57 TaxID=3425863 RepID=UPI003D6F05A5